MDCSIEERTFSPKELRAIQEFPEKENVTLAHEDEIQTNGNSAMRKSTTITIRSLVVLSVFLLTPIIGFFSSSDPLGRMDPLFSLADFSSAYAG